MMALSLRILNLQNFIDQNGIIINDEIKVYLMKMVKKRSPAPTIEDPQILDLLQKYELFEKLTLEGEHGKTAQFCMMYVNFIDYYLLLNASIRKNDFELFKFVLPKINNLFSTFNHPNYAQYLVRYHDNLLKIDNSHPGLREQLENGSLGVKRTEKPFSKQTINLSLEQTVNLHAANRMTVTKFIRNSISARQRWARSHSIRTTIISHTMQQAGLTKMQDVSDDLKRNRIKKSANQLHELINGIKCNMNPFFSDIEKNNLFNICTGKAASEQIENFLLNAEKIGHEKRKDFIATCVEDPSKFDQAIPQTKIHNFTEAIKKNKIKVAGKDVELRMQCDFFGQLLQISLQKTLDLDKVLTYQLTPVPLSMCHLDGSICKTDKSVLLKLLEREVKSEPPQHTDVMIFDVFFVLHLMTEVPRTFCKISKKLLQTICQKEAKIIIIAFDQYFSPSIKDTEHALRGLHESNFNLDVPDQERPS